MHLKWHIVGLGTERGQMNTRGFLEYREKQGLPFIYLFWLFDLFRLISTGSNEPVGLIVDLFFLVVLKPSAKISLGSFFCVSLWPACVDTAWFSLSHWDKQQNVFWWPCDLSPSVTRSPNFSQHFATDLPPSDVYCESNIHFIALRNCSIICPVVKTIFGAMYCSSANIQRLVCFVLCEKGSKSKILTPQGKLGEVWFFSTLVLSALQKTAVLALIYQPSIHHLTHFSTHNIRSHSQCAVSIHLKLQTWDMRDMRFLYCCFMWYFLCCFPPDSNSVNNVKGEKRKVWWRKLTC